MSTYVSRILADRQMTSFYLSVGTGLALETIFNPTAPRLDDTRDVIKADINRYDIHYFNIETLIRNIFTSIQNYAQREILYNSIESSLNYYVDTLLDEIVMLETIYDNVDTKFKIHVPDYLPYRRVAPRFMLTGTVSNSRRPIYDIIDKVRSRITQLDEFNRYAIYDSQLRASNGRKAMITTHIALDLLSYNNLTELALLESHTGKVKGVDEFNSKYHNYGKNDLSIMPFNERVLYVLGDDNRVGSLGREHKKLLYHIALDKKWTPFTSRNKVANDMVEWYKVFPEEKPKSLVFG